MDYLVSAKRMNNLETHIIAVKAMRVIGTVANDPQIFDRQSVVDAIKRGSSFATSKLVNNYWQIGADIHIVTINGVNYLRTDKNQTARDNLGELPEF